MHARVRVRGGHCQVPCGIFDDPGMVAQLREASATIRKAMTQINELASGLSDPVKLNQSMRWVMTKEEHCSKIITMIGEYCLCQRIKAAEMSPEDYVDSLKIHHLVMQNAMKCKQNVDTDFCCHLDHSLDDLSKMYKSRVNYFKGSAVSTTGSSRPGTASSFTDVWNGGNEKALDELLRRGRGSSKKIEFDGLRASDKDNIERDS